MKSIKLIILFALIALASTACSDDSSTNTPVTPEVKNVFSSKNIYLPATKGDTLTYVYTKKNISSGVYNDSLNLVLLYQDSTTDYRFCHEYANIDDPNKKENIELTDYTFSGKGTSNTISLTSLHKNTSDGKYYVDINELMGLNSARNMVFKNSLLFGDGDASNTTYTINGVDYPAYQISWSTLKIVFVKKIGIVYMTYKNVSNHIYEWKLKSFQLK